MRSMDSSIGWISGRRAGKRSVAYRFSSEVCTVSEIPLSFKLLCLERSSRSAIFALSHCSIPSSLASTRSLTVVVILLTVFSIKFTHSPREKISAENFWLREMKSTCKDFCRDTSISLSSVSMTGWLLVGKEQWRRTEYFVGWRRFPPDSPGACGVAVQSHPCFSWSGTRRTCRRRGQIGRCSPRSHLSICQLIQEVSVVTRASTSDGRGQGGLEKELFLYVSSSSLGERAVCSLCIVAVLTIVFWS